MVCAVDTAFRKRLSAPDEDGLCGSVCDALTTAFPMPIGHDLLASCDPKRPVSIECRAFGIRYRLVRSDSMWRATRVSNLQSTQPHWEHHRFGTVALAIGRLWGWWAADLVVPLENAADRVADQHRAWLRGRPGFPPRSSILRERISDAANELASASMEAARAMGELRALEALMDVSDRYAVVRTNWVACGEAMINSGRNRVRLSADGCIMWEQP